MSSTTKVTIYSTGTGVCALTQREADGLTVTFEDGSPKEQFLSWKALRQLVGMRVPRLAKPLAGSQPPVPTPVNGAPPAK